MTLFKGIVLITLAFSGLCSCSSSALKAPAAELSPFLGQTPALTASREVSPFALSGGSPVTPQHGIYIAPVTLSYLRDASKSLTKGDSAKASRGQAAQELAEYARAQFIAAFQSSPKARYVVQASPGRDCVTLELALTELNRNTFTGSVTRFGMNAIAVPGTDAILAKVTRGLKGNIAIEGKVMAGSKGVVVYQFADNEESRSAILLPVKDFQAYGQARDAIRAWAKQFEEVTRTPPGQRVKGSGVFSLF